jgi:hypothetical protein
VVQVLQEQPVELEVTEAQYNPLLVSAEAVAAEAEGLDWPAPGVQEGLELLAQVRELSPLMQLRLEVLPHPLRFQEELVAALQ